MDRPAIETHQLSKIFGSTAAVDGLDLDVPAATVFGYLGPNGAGKSTTIRMLMGLIRPTSGSVTAFGLDAIRQSRDVHRIVGYLPGDFSAYNDLTAAQYLDYLAHLRGGVEPDRVQLLAKRFDLDPGRPIGAMSHGNRQKVGIIQAFMHEPQLLILDEPTSGLDPLMQREFLDLVRERRDAGATVFLSSHVLTEVEAVADVVAIIRKGRLVMTCDVAALKLRTRRRVDLRFVDGAALPIVELTRVPSVRDLEVVDGSLLLTVEGSMAELMRVAAPFGIERMVSNELDLEDVFLQYYEDEER